MGLPPHLLKFRETPIPVLDDGHVQLIDVMGCDNTIVNAARVSFGGSAEAHSNNENRHLIRYLMRHRHTTPFEMCEIVFRVRVPMDCWRQWIRHRTASVNEYSTRYKPAIDSAAKTDPNQWRAQSKNNKQGSAGNVTEWPKDFARIDDDNGTYPDGGWVGNLYYPSPGDYLTEREEEAQQFVRDVYEERLHFGVAKEQARKDLPLSTYTEAYWKCDLHNLFHFLGLRLDPHAQLEIRQYAEAIATVVKEWVPWAWEAFEDYRLQGMYLTRFEVAGLHALIAYCRECALDDVPGAPEQVNEAYIHHALKGSNLPAPKPGKAPPREWAEFEAKLRKLLGQA